MFRHFQRIILFCLLLGAPLAFGVNALSSEGASLLRVEITGEAGLSGTVRVALFREEANWLEATPFRGAAQKVDALPALIYFDNLPEGDYAISVFLDENHNEDLDLGLFNIPQEPYGFSNNARNRFGPADFHEAKFTVGSGMTQQVIAVKKLGKK
jgi:uncharacterized protein (DUF2141 family)